MTNADQICAPQTTFQAELTALAPVVNAAVRQAMQKKSDICDHYREFRECRLDAGRKLLEVQRLVAEQGVISWRQWCARYLTECSYSYACRLVKLASTEDPEAALAAERAKDRARKASGVTETPCSVTRELMALIQKAPRRDLFKIACRIWDHTDSEVHAKLRQYQEHNAS